MDSKITYHFPIITCILLSMVKFMLTFNIHRRSSYSTTPLLYPRAFTDKLQTCQHPDHIQFLLVMFPLAQQCTVSEIYKIEKFILMHGERKQKREEEKKQHKKGTGIAKIYTMQNIKRSVYCHCTEYKV